LSNEIMSPVHWLTVLTDQIAMAKGFAGELERQLRAQARFAAGIDLADGGHALLPPDGGFAVQFRTVAGTVVGVIEADLVDPAAIGHAVALAWRSRSHPDQRIEPNHDAADVEFFWLALPVAELAAGTQLDVSAVANAITAGFPIEWDVHDWSSVRLRWMARRGFSPDEQAALTAALAGAVRDWNASARHKIHHVSEADVAPDRHVVGFYADLGAAGPDAVVALVNAVAASAAAPMIARAAIGRRV
jgi:hypothetical protein